MLLTSRAPGMMTPGDLPEALRGHHSPSHGPDMCSMHEQREGHGIDRPPCAKCGGELIGVGFRYLCRPCYDGGTRYCSYRDHAGGRVMDAADMGRDANTCARCSRLATSAQREANREQWANGPRAARHD